MDTRKIVSLPAQLAKAIEDFRFDERISTEAEAIRRLLEAGLKTHRRKERKGGESKKP
jgi:metal-responsive CopG/Arc/MetJ family transcriptional regulator